MLDIMAAGVIIFSGSDIIGNLADARSPGRRISTDLCYLRTQLAINRSYQCIKTLLFGTRVKRLPSHH